MNYQLNKAIHPGVSVNAALTHLGMSQKNLADRTGLSEKTISQIVNGEASITVETAAKFENVLGGSASFWLNLESQFKTTELRLSLTKKASKEVSLAKRFPYTELAKRKYVDDTRNSEARVFNLWKFFGVDSLSMVESIEVAAYRRGYVVESEEKRGALAAWLRCGEIIFTKEVANKIKDYESSKLKAILPEIRKMTQMQSPNFFADLQNVLADVGVGLVAVQFFPGTKASGATRWISGRPLIQLSTYGKNADKVWFTLFHEIGHILLHGRKEQFISFIDSSKMPEEIKADEFAANYLIPREAYKRFIIENKIISAQNIMQFAEEQKINPGIVVGRLKKDKLLNYAAYLNLHTKLEVKSNN